MTFGVPKHVLEWIRRGQLLETDVVVPDVWLAEKGFAFHETGNCDPPYQVLGSVPTANVVLVTPIEQRDVAKTGDGTIVHIRWTGLVI